jgi:hypothetical protein
LDDATENALGTSAKYNTEIWYKNYSRKKNKKTQYQECCNEK